MVEDLTMVLLFLPSALSSINVVETITSIAMKIHVPSMLAKSVDTTKKKH